MQDAATIQAAGETLAVLGFLGTLTVMFLTMIWWLGAAIMTCFVADLKGFSRGWWLVVGLLFGPLGLLGAAGLPDRRPGARA